MIDLLQHSTAWAAIMLMAATAIVLMLVWRTADRTPIPVRSHTVAPVRRSASDPR